MHFLRLIVRDVVLCCFGCFLHATFLKPIINSLLLYLSTSLSASFLYHCLVFVAFSYWIMKKLAIFGLALLLCSFQAEARPSGAPNGACSSLIPRHAPNQVGNDTFPYEVDLSTLVSGYDGGRSYKSKMNTGVE